MKKTLSLILVGVMALSLVACGGGSLSSDGGSQAAIADNANEDNNKELKKKKLEYTGDDFKNSKVYYYLEGNTIHLTNKSIEGKTFELIAFQGIFDYSDIIRTEEKDIYETRPDLFLLEPDREGFLTLKYLFLKNIEEVVIDNKIMTESIIFNNWTALKTIKNIDNLMTKRLSFEWCYNIENITGIKNINTSYINDMRYMFAGCGKLNEINVSNWDVSNVTDMSHMFDGCTNLSKIDISKWDVSNVADMSSMFAGCDSLETLDISKWKLNENLSSTAFFDNKDINGY